MGRAHHAWKRWLVSTWNAGWWKREVGPGGELAQDAAPLGSSGAPTPWRGPPECQSQWQAQAAVIWGKVPAKCLGTRGPAWRGPPPGAVLLLRQVRVCLPGKQHHRKWQSRAGLGMASVRDKAAGPGWCWPLGGPEGSREPSRVGARGWPGQCVAYPGRLPAARCGDRRQEQGRWRLQGVGRGPGRKVTRGGTSELWG